jgi:hypothetical protein
MANTKYPNLKQNIISALGYIPERKFETEMINPEMITAVLGYVPANQSEIISLFKELAPDIVVDSSSYEWDIGETEATITVSASGGLGQINYSLGSQTNQTGIFLVSSQGVYTVIITDSLGSLESVDINVLSP